METQQAKEILQRYLDGKCNGIEAGIVEGWYNTQLSGEVNIDEKDYDRLYKKLQSSLPHSKQPSIRPLLVNKIKIASMIAAALAIIILGINLYNSQRHQKIPVVSLLTQDLLPGRNGGTLTLANGKRVYLGGSVSGKLASIEGLDIIKSSSGQLIYKLTPGSVQKSEANTLQTGNGEQIQLILPDGSLVFLNAASKLTYPTSFIHQNTRKVELSGEAYFEIAKDSKHPFIVKTYNKTNSQEVKVLGTHFNVSAYSDEQTITTTLLEGAVSIDSNISLNPGQLAINHGGVISVRPADVSKETAWINNAFHFEGESTEVVMKQVARWYGLSVIYQNPELKLIPLSGYISRTKKLSTVLERIGKATGLKFTLRGNILTVENL